MTVWPKAKGKSAGSEKGEAYEYAHDLEDVAGVGGVSGQDYLGVEKRYYRPVARGVEATFAERLEELRWAREQRRGPRTNADGTD